LVLQRLQAQEWQASLQQRWRSYLLRLEQWAGTGDRAVADMAVADMAVADMAVADMAVPVMEAPDLAAATVAPIACFAAP
jgi:hypothetical protein